MGEDLQIGRVVKSLCGRDKGYYFLILEIIDDHQVLIADGRIRKIQQPKRKKIKHLRLMPEASMQMGQINYKDLQSQNAFLVRELAKLGYSNKGEV